MKDQTFKRLVAVTLLAATLAACGGGGGGGGSSSPNVAPVASAGPAQRVVARSLVTLDGSRSSDANGDSLTYSWSLASRPSGSTATLSNSNSSRPTFRPDLPGSYTATLTVSDGKAVSSSTVVVTVVPELAIFFISGHTEEFDGEPSYSYLHETAGPNIVADLNTAGYTVEHGYFVDDANDVRGDGGYQSLVATMRAVRDEYVAFGTRAIVIAHSHGGVWAHSAIRQVNDLTITAAVDLDTSSYGWGITGHDTQNSFIGGDPRNRFTINRLVTCPAYSVPSEATSNYDIEDVVFQNVRFAFEVRSGEMAPAGDEWYDEKWSIREDGNLDGLSCYYSNTSHTEVHQPGGSTIPVVKSWLRARLAEG